jgi:hypothetical protein
VESFDTKKDMINFEKFEAKEGIPPTQKQSIPFFPIKQSIVALGRLV